MTVEQVSLSDVGAMIADGRITDAKTIIGLLLVRDRLAAESGPTPNPGSGAELIGEATRQARRKL
ncbi:MAG: hypothetical protein WKF43_17330 [Acidimicrobiales bacterium]